VAALQNSAVEITNYIELSANWNPSVAQLEVTLELLVPFSESICASTLMYICMDHLCVLVIRVPGYISRRPGSIPGATRFSEK
jgi:hypothetical protein